MNNFILHPLFNTPIALINMPLSVDEQTKLTDYINLQDWQKASQGDNDNENNKSKQNKNLYTLEDDKLSFLKNKIINNFYSYKNKIFRYEDFDFKTTTSWFTKTEYGQKSYYHNHSNCMFSAVFYVNQPENSGNITFTKYEDKRFNIEPSEYNLYNSSAWTFIPRKHDLIIFPSETYHKIETHKSKECRYSLALNFMPVGKIGVYDSQLELK
jgi:uncharacterized protein (TIGR02466 family)